MSVSKVVPRPLLRAEVLDRYVEFVAARCRPNTMIATTSDLRAFFAVIDKSAQRWRLGLTAGLQPGISI